MTHSFCDPELPENRVRELLRESNPRENFSPVSAAVDKEAGLADIVSISLRHAELRLQKPRLKTYSPFDDFENNPAEAGTNRRLGKIESSYIGK